MDVETACSHALIDYQICSNCREDVLIFMAKPVSKLKLRKFADAMYIYCLIYLAHE